MISTSPLRYPGGKARFTEIIWEAILQSNAPAEVLVEPFCGGAGATLGLLEAGKVQRLALNDLDPLVASFWKVVFGKAGHPRHDLEWLVHQVETAELSIDEWRRQRAFQPRTLRQAAWKCLYLNRTSFNGILHKAGPIGGWGQSKRTLGVRFNREKLMRRLKELFERREQVERVSCMDWRRFCQLYKKTSTAYVYLDPPYYHRAEQLYGHLFDAQQHQAFRDYLLQYPTPWLLSYDDAQEVRDLYANCIGIHAVVLDTTYSAHPKGGNSFVGRELLFSNCPLPNWKHKTSADEHVGMSVVGSIENTPSPVAPHRISTSTLRSSNLITV